MHVHSANSKLNLPNGIWETSSYYNHSFHSHFNQRFHPNSPNKQTNTVLSTTIPQTTIAPITTASTTTTSSILTIKKDDVLEDNDETLENDRLRRAGRRRIIVKNHLKFDCDDICGVPDSILAQGHLENEDEPEENVFPPSGQQHPSNRVCLLKFLRMFICF